MFDIWGTIKIALIGVALLVAIAVTWEVQEWRWEAKERDALQEQMQAIQAEAKKEATAATQYETKREKTNDTYQKIDRALQNQKPGAAVCFDPDKLRVVNSALSRKTPNPGRPSGALPKVAPAQ